MTGPPLRIGVLGAAQITPSALIGPARRVDSVEVVAVAARDPQRAEAFAKRHRIGRVHPSYEALVADPEIDAVYNPLPNSLHAEWTMRALEAGKHVLCEKPLASNAAEAEQMVACAKRCDRKLVEAFHYRFHPLAARMREVVAELGEIEHVEMSFCVPLPFPRDIRYRWDLAGGALMDTGCYAISIVRWLADAEPEVLSARARLARRNVDRWMRAELRFPKGVSGRITTALFSATLLKIVARVRGSRGEMRVLNPILPQLYHSLVWTCDGVRRRERVEGEATYTHQLRAFAEHVASDAPLPVDGRDSIANLRVIDAIYRAAGLPLRGSDA